MRWRRVMSSVSHFAAERRKKTQSLAAAAAKQQQQQQPQQQQQGGAPTPAAAELGELASDGGADSAGALTPQQQTEDEIKVGRVHPSLTPA